MSEDNEKIFGGIKDKLIVWELGNAVVTGMPLRHSRNTPAFYRIGHQDNDATKH